VTAPELSLHFGRTLARQVAEALRVTGTRDVWEFGAGSGALAEQLIEALDAADAGLESYTIVDLSGSLRERQQARLAVWGDRVRWVHELPEKFSGVVVGNEVLDAMPVQLLVRLGGVWHERGVALHNGALAWADRPTALRPPREVDSTHDYLTEIHPQAEGWLGKRPACRCWATPAKAVFCSIAACWMAWKTQPCQTG
jgi:SAM-dependent MidA family methyltransferase